jgi:Tol biopolymer transport system component
MRSTVLLVASVVVMMLLATLYGCDQANTPAEKKEQKGGVEGAKEKAQRGEQGAAGAQRDKQSSGSADGTTQRVSVSSSEAQADNWSDYPSISSNGPFVAFDSRASNLVENDTNNTRDAFVRDLRTGTTQRVSVSSSGEQGNNHSGYPAISSNGRMVAFLSLASNLVADDTNGDDVFVHDLRTGATERVSVNSSEAQADGGSSDPLSISSKGRFVAFASSASNLVEDDTNNISDVFVRDLQRGTTERVSISSSGEQGNDHSYPPSISSDGIVAFRSDASNLVANDTNNTEDIFVHDLQTGATERVNVSSSEAQAGGGSSNPSISSDGRFVAFESEASDLVPNDTNNTRDAFVRDLWMGSTERVSIDSSGAQASAGSFRPSISSDGRFVAFTSDASNLVARDTNGFIDVFVHELPDTTAP